MARMPVRNHLHQLCYRDLREYFRGKEFVLPLLSSDEYAGIGAMDPLSPGSSAEEVASILLLTSIVKKFEDEKDEYAANRCLLAFLESNLACSLWEPPPPKVPPLINVVGRISPRDNYPGYVDSAKADAYATIRECLLDTFERPTPQSLLRIPGFDGSDPWSWENIFLVGNVGPGASIDAAGGSWYEKFYQSSLSYANPILREAYLRSLGNPSLRSAAENQRQNQFGWSQVVGGRYGSVPKSFDTERSIETQPALEMWAQKGIAAIAEHFVRAKYGIDLSVQPEINRELARRMSISGQGATIDLSEASNRIPLRFIREALVGTKLLDRIENARVKNTTLPIGTTLELHMVGTMGNGFTFILETAVFLACVEAAYAIHGDVPPRQPHLSLLTPRDSIERWISYPESYENTALSLAVPHGFNHTVLLTELDLPEWGVFGDDIIVPSRVIPDLLLCLEVIGAQVNTSKSHWLGGFRESCGGDYWYGTPVRGVYCRTLARPEDKISLINRLNRWSAQWGIPLRRTCQFLWSQVSEKLLIPLAESDDAGLKVPFSLAPKYPRSKSLAKSDRDHQTLTTPYKFRKPRPETVTFRGAQCTIYGPGLLLAMLKGEMVSSWQAIRSELTRMDASEGRKANKETPYWLTLTKRALTDLSEGRPSAYDTRWGVTHDWDASDFDHCFICALEWALEANLGRKPN